MKSNCKIIARKLYCTNHHLPPILIQYCQFLPSVQWNCRGCCNRQLDKSLNSLCIIIYSQLYTMGLRHMKHQFQNFLILLHVFYIYDIVNPTHQIMASRILFVTVRSLGSIGPCSCDVKMKLVVASLTFCTSVK